MRREYDAFGRPVEPPETRSAGRPSAAPTPAEDRSHGGREAPRAAPSRGGRTPAVRGLPPASGGAAAGTTGRRLLGLAGSTGVVVLVALAVVGALLDDDRPARSGVGPGADRPALTPARAERSIGLLRSAMRPGDRVVSVSLAESYAVARVLAAGGGTRSLSVDPDGDVRSAMSGVTSRTSEGVPVDDLETAAPRRVVEAVDRGLGPGATGRVTSLSAYSYRDEPLRWSASVPAAREVARSWTADAAGRAVVRLRDGAPAPPVGDPGPAVVPEGLTGRSLLKAANLRAALGAVGSVPALQDRTPGEVRLTTLNVEPERVLVGVADGPVRRLFGIDAALGIDPSAVTRDTSSETVPLTAVDPAGPSRALRAIGRRLSTDAAAQVQSISLSGAGDAADDRGAAWYVVLDGEGEDRVWRASMDGRRVGRSGEDLTR